MVDILSPSSGSFGLALGETHSSPGSTPWSPQLHPGELVMCPWEMWQDPAFRDRIQQMLETGQQEIADEERAEAARIAKIKALFPDDSDPGKL